MSTATVQQFKQDPAEWLGIARHGETVAIVEQGEIIAQLGPPSSLSTGVAAPRKSMAEWMDIRDRRMQRTFGSRVVTDSVALLEDMRSDRE